MKYVKKTSNKLFLMDSVSRIVPKSFFGNPTSKRSIEEQISREISSFRHTTTNSFKTGWLEYKIHAKKKFRCRRVKSRKSANIQNSESRNFPRLFNPSWFKIVQILTRWSDRVESFFCLDFITKMTGFRRIFDLATQERYLVRVLLLMIVASSHSRFLIRVSKTISLRRHSGACCGPSNCFLSCFRSFLNAICDAWCSIWTYWSDFVWFGPKLWTPYPPLEMPPRRDAGCSLRAHLSYYGFEEIHFILIFC